MRWGIACLLVVVGGVAVEDAQAERRANTLDRSRAIVHPRRPPIVPTSHRDDPDVVAGTDAYETYEADPVFEIGDDVTYRVTAGTRRCDEQLFDPVITALRDAGIDSQRSACLRRELSIHLPLSALIDTPGFHGEIDGALQIGGRTVVAERLELGASLRLARYQFVQNAVNKATEAQFGPLVMSAAYGRRWGVSAVALVGALEVPFTRDNMNTTRLAGTLTLLAMNRLGARTTLHSRLGFVGARAWSLGGSTGRMAFRAGADLVRRLGQRWALDLGAEIQAGWYDGFDGATIRVGAQRRFGFRYRGMLGIGLPVGGDERTNAVIDIGVIRDLD